MSLSGCLLEKLVPLTQSLVGKAGSSADMPIEGEELASAGGRQQPAGPL